MATAFDTFRLAAGRGRCLRLIAYPLGLVLFATIFATSVSAAPSLPGMPCGTAAMPLWTEPERWAWGQICLGGAADFNKRYGQEDTERRPNSTLEMRTLSSRFLKTILFYEPYRSAIGVSGVSIVGAHFSEQIDLANGNLAHSLVIYRSAFNKGLDFFRLESSKGIFIMDSKISGEADMRGVNVAADFNLRLSDFDGLRIDDAKIGGGVILTGAKVRETLDVNNAKIDGQLSMGGNSEFGAVNLIRSVVGSDMTMSGSKFGGDLNLTGAKIGGFLYMTEVSCKELKLYSAEVSGRVVMSDAKFGGDLNLNAAKIGGSLDMIGEFTTASLSGAEIAGDVRILASRFSGDLDLNSLRVGRSLHMGSGPEGSRSEFLHVDLRGARIGGSIEMSGSRFAGILDMSDIKVDRQLRMNGKAEFDGVNLSRASIGSNLDMDETKFAGGLDIGDAKIDGSLFFRNGTAAKLVHLRNTSVGGNLELSGSKFAADINMDQMSIQGNLFMQTYEGQVRSEFKDVILNNTRVTKELHMDGSKFDGTLRMDPVIVGSHLFMRWNGEFNDVRLVSSKIGGFLETVGSRFSGDLDMKSIHVGGEVRLSDSSDPDEQSNKAEFAHVSLFGSSIKGNLILNGAKIDGETDFSSMQVDGFVRFEDARIAKPLKLYLARIGSYFDLSGATLQSADLSGTVVSGTMFLGIKKFPRVNWAENAHFNLRYASVGAIQDAFESWPKRLDLEGFRYQGIGKLGVDELSSYVELRPVDWLAKDRSYSPQPYEHLARNLQSIGHLTSAKEVLFQGRKRALNEAPMDWAEWVWQNVLLALIGFGYRIYYVFFWIAVFVFIGAAVIRNTKEGKESGLVWGYAYSLDKLLPLTKLREKHHAIDISGVARYYFYFHQLMGFVLASFLIAGLAGLTK